MLEVCPPHVGREAEVVQRRYVFQGIAVVSHLAFQRLLRSGGEGQHMCTQWRIVNLRAARPSGCRGLFQDHMGIRAAEAEGADTRQTRTSAGAPGCQLGVDCQGPGPVDMWAGFGEVQVGWNLFTLQGQGCFDHAGNPGGSFQVADIRLHGSDPQR